MVSLKRRFFEALYKSINPDTSTLEQINDGIKEYYKKEYLETIKKEFDIKGIKSLELNKDEKSKLKLAPICSLASSGRMTYLYFSNKKCTCLDFEKNLNNDITPTPSHTKMDVYEEHKNLGIYYECKCQEILETSHGMFTESYKKSKYFRELLGLKKDEEPVYTPYSISGKTYMTFNLKEFDINIDAQYNKIHFDVKQLICHLIAIAVANDKKIDELKKEKPGAEPKWEARLQYVFFKPDHLDEDSEKAIYEDMKEKEIKPIWESSRIKEFCENHHIEYPLPDPWFLPVVKACDDPIFKEAFKK